MAKKTTVPAFARHGRRTVAFVNVPSEPGRWFLVDRAVVVVACPKCGAAKGEPCLKPRRTRTTGRTRRNTGHAGRECGECRRVHPAHKAGACLARRQAFAKLGGIVQPRHADTTRCASCGASFGIDPGTAICPVCSTPRNSAGHYSKGAA